MSQASQDEVRNALSIAIGYFVRVPGTVFRWWLIPDPVENVAQTPDRVFDACPRARISGVTVTKPRRKTTRETIYGRIVHRWPNATTEAPPE